jgi:diphthamide synthase (EF-2-diphthine--ammonia ligase)
MTVHSALSWSGGKDSALTLWALRCQGVEPEALITTVTDAYDRISMHGVRRELLARQADAVGIPLVEVRIPPACVNDVYEARMAEAFASPPLSDVEAVAFGDLSFSRMSVPTARSDLPQLAGTDCSRFGDGTPACWRENSSPRAFRRSSLA